jgi:hypothetical protein
MGDRYGQNGNGGGDAAPLLERVLGGIGALLALALIVFLGYQALAVHAGVLSCRPR